jgi:hypothetical protein
VSQPFPLLARAGSDQGSQIPREHSAKLEQPAGRPRADRLDRELLPGGALLNAKDRLYRRDGTNRPELHRMCDFFGLNWVTMRSDSSVSGSPLNSPGPAVLL